MHHPRSVTHITLWIFQVLWGLFFSLNGLGKVFWFNSALWNQARQEVPWASAVPQTLLVLVGTCEFLGGIGLILPAMTRVKPRLISFAGFGLMLVMILAAAFHIARGEYAILTVNVVLGGVAAFIAYGRSFVKPIVPASISAVGVLKGLAVLGALILVGIAPVWYRLTHLH